MTAVWRLAKYAVFHLSFTQSPSVVFRR